MILTIFRKPLFKYIQQLSQVFRLPTANCRLLTALMFFCLSANFTLVQAQPGSVSEKEVQIQKVFIEASKEKILGRFENSAMLFKEVLKKDKKNHAAAYELARVYDVLEENEKALASAKMAATLDPTNTWYQMFLGDVYQKLNKNQEAADTYRELIKKDVSNEYYYYKLAFFLVAAKKTDEAIKIYDALEKQIGVNEECANRKHRLYLGMGNQKKAAKELEKLADAFPTNINYRHLLAEYYGQAKQKEKAKQVYQDILKLEPNDAKAALALVDSKQGGNRSNDDIAYLNSLKPIFSNKAAGLDEKIKKLIPFIQKIAQAEQQASPLTTAAIDLVTILEEVHPNQAKVFSAHGDLLYYSGNKKDALNKYRQSVDTKNSVFTVWEQMMYIYSELNDLKALIKVTEEAMDLYPNKAKSYYFNGLAQLQKEEYDDAVDMFQQALVMSAKSPNMQFELHQRLAQAHYQSGKYQKAYASFDKALTMNPKSAKVLSDYSYALAQSGEQLEKAKSMAQTSNELKPNSASAQATFGWVLYKMKEFKDSKTWFEKAIQNGGGNASQVLENYGDVLFQLDEVEDALIQWQKAQAAGGTSEKLEKKISDKQLYE